MAKGFDVLNVKSAVKARNKMDLSRTHLTTARFGQILPLFCEELIPGDKINIGANYFARMAPLVKPTYGKVSFHTMSGFVPYHQLADDVEAWLAGKTVWEGENPSSRFIRIYDYVTFLINAAVSSTVSEGEAYDFCYTDSSGNTVYKRWTNYGKYWVKILNCLGYAAPQGVDLRTTSTWYQKDCNIFLSALPLLGFAKLYNDYMSQSTRYNAAPLTAYLKNVRHNKITDGYVPGTHCITAAGMLTIFSGVRVMYDNDYFFSAWQSPNNAINNIDSLTNVVVPKTGSDDTLNDTVRNSLNGVFALKADAPDKMYQRTLDFLKSFDDWVRRNNYSGSRAVQQIYSRFGIKTDDYRSNYAHVVSTDIIPISVGDVTATSDTADLTSDKGSVLGSYAGKGIMDGEKGVSFKSNDHGMFYIFGWFTVVPMNAFGYDRSVLRNTPLDYYNPEFDGVGVDAISYGELYTNPRATLREDTSLDSQTFGFTERYNSYRYGRDKITGEFRHSDITSDMNVWHTGNILSAVRMDGDMFAQNTNFISMSPVNSEYDRIFSDIGANSDKFYVTAQFKVSAVRPMLSLNQVPRLGEGDTAVPRNGNEIS